MLHASLLNYKQLAQDLVDGSQRMYLTYNMDGELVFKFNTSTLKMPVQTTDARVIEQLSCVWEHFVELLTKKFEQTLLDFVKNERKNFN